MDLNNVVLEIISEAEKKASEIAEEGKKERENLLDKARDNVNKLKTKMEKGNKEKIKQERTKELAVSRMNAKKIEMNAKKELIEKVYEKLANEIEASENDLLQKLFEAGKKQIEIETVYVNKKDLNTIFNGVEIKEADITGGIIIENKDGSEKINLSLDIIVETVRKDTVNEVSKILFGDEE